MWMQENSQFYLGEGGKIRMSRISPKRYPVLSTFLVLVAAYSLTYLYERSLLRLVWYIRDQHQFGPYWQVDFLKSIAPVIVLVMIAALAWLGTRILPPSRISAVLYILSGFFTIGLHFYHYLGFISGEFFFPMWLNPQTFLGGIRVSFMAFGAERCAPTIQYLATGCILIGIVILWKVKKERQDAAKENI